MIIKGLSLLRQPFVKEDTMLKKILALLLAVLMLSFAFAACKDEEVPPTDEPENPSAGLENKGPALVDSGKIGESSLTWELYNNGYLYIKGSGAMGELEKGEGGSVIHPWHQYMGIQSSTPITTLVVESGVTALATNAFASCAKLQNVRIADTVTVLPEKCFKYCEQLRTVQAKGVVQIEDNAFDSCVMLSTVTFSASLEFVGDGAFLYAGEQADSFSVRLAGTEAEWNAAKAKMDASESDELAIWTGNQKLTDGLEGVLFVAKTETN